LGVGPEAAKRAQVINCAYLENDWLKLVRGTIGISGKSSQGAAAAAANRLTGWCRRGSAL
jgi:hypothetical protein